MATFIVILTAIVIFTMVGIKVLHGYIVRKKALGFKIYNNEYIRPISSFRGLIIRRAILFCLALFAIFGYLAFRYFPLFNVGSNQGGLNGVGRFANDATQVEYNKGGSMVLFLDLCTLLGLVCPLVIIFDRKDSWSLAFANLGILGSCMTFFGSYTIFEIPGSFNYLLFGTGESFTDLPVSFMIHMGMLMFSLYTFLGRRNGVWLDGVKMSFISFGYMFYVLIVTQSMGITSHATGLAYNDYISITGTYHSPYADVIKLFRLDGSQGILAALGLWAVFAGMLIILLPALHKLSHHYTDVVFDNDYVKLYNQYSNNSFVRGLAAYNLQ